MGNRSSLPHPEAASVCCSGDVVASVQCGAAASKAAAAVKGAAPPSEPAAREAARDAKDAVPNASKQEVAAPHDAPLPAPAASAPACPSLPRPRGQATLPRRPCSGTPSARAQRVRVSTATNALRDSDRCVV